MRISSNTAVNLRFDLDITGEADTVVVTVENEASAVVGSVGSGVTVDATGSVVLVTIASGVNALANGVARGHRIVRLTYTSEEFTGSRYLEQDYQILGAAPLEVQVNSFQTYNEAVSIMADMVDVQHLVGADRDTRISALQQAWIEICRLYFVVDRDEDQTRIHDHPWSEVWSMEKITAVEFGQFEDRFRRCLKRAQILQADHLIGGGGAEQRRMDGIMSSTIGETSQMFRTGKPADYAVCAKALKELRGYVTFAGRLARG